MVEGSEITVAEARKMLGYRTDDYILRLLRAGLIDGRKVANRHPEDDSISDDPPQPSHLLTERTSRPYGAPC